MLLLNASGCLDALTAPEVARSLDAFVTKTVTPEPREGNPPVRIAETDAGMLNAIGLANPGRERFLSQTLPALLARRPALGLGRRFLGRRLRGDVRGARGRHDRAEPLLPERRRGARSRRPRSSPPAAPRPASPLRQALPGGVGHRRGRPGGRGGRRGRPLAREHDPRPRARRSAPAEARSGRRRLLRPGAEADRPGCRPPLPARHRSCRSSAWAVCNPGATCSSWSPAERPTSRSERCSSPIRMRRCVSAGELAGKSSRRPDSTDVRRRFAPLTTVLVLPRQLSKNVPACKPRQGC